MTRELLERAREALQSCTQGDSISFDGRLVHSVLAALDAHLSAPTSQPDFAATPAAPAVPIVSDEMVGRFLCWLLPRDFMPDCGISFDGSGNATTVYERTWPIGTNLLTAVQARAMLEHVLAAAPSAQPTPTAQKEGE